MYYNPIESGKRIKKLRRTRKLTQEQLAVHLNISDRHMRSLEIGETAPSLDLFVEMAGFFDSTLDYLIIGRTISEREEHINRQLHRHRTLWDKLEKLIKEFSEMPDSL